MKKKKPRSEKKMDVTLHTDPMEMTAPHMATLLALLAHAWEMSLKFAVEYEPSYPIHVVVEFDGKRACGSVSPAGSSMGGTSIIAKGSPRFGFTGKCN